MCCEERGTNGAGMNVCSARRTCIATARCNALTMQILTNPFWPLAELLADTKNQGRLAAARNTLAVLMNVRTASCYSSANRPVFEQIPESDFS